MSAAARLLPARDGGTPCGRNDAHNAHGECPGLRPAEFVSMPCSYCRRSMWGPPEKVIGGRPVVPVCSAACAMLLVETLANTKGRPS